MKDERVFLLSGKTEEDKTSITEQTNEMEAYCEDKGLTIAARYQEVGRGWTKKRPEFQRMLEDARQGRFDPIVCWKSDRLSRGMYPAAALMEVVEAHQIRLEAVMDAIDMKTFGLMAAIGKIELDNFRERATMGKRGSAKQGRMPTGSIPYGYSIGEDGKPEICEPEAEVVRRIFRQYAHEGVRVPTITRQLASEDAPRRVPGSRWHEAFVGYLLKKEVYKGIWRYGQARHVAMEGGDRVYEQPEDTWIGVPFPPLVDEETWDRAQALKKERLIRSKRNTKTFFLLQHMLRCAECGLRFASRSTSKRYTKSKGKVYRYDLKVPYRNYQCYGMRREGQQCRGRPYIRADQLEGLVWNEVKGMVQNPELIVAGIASLDADVDGGLEKQIASTERDLQRVQLEEDRVIRLYVSGKITEEQLDRQRKFITERLEAVRAELDDYRARQSSATEKRELMENIVEWAARFGQELDDLPDEQRRDVLRLIVEEIVVDGDNNVRITLGIPAKRLVSFAKERSRFLSYNRHTILSWDCQRQVDVVVFVDGHPVQKEPKRLPAPLIRQAVQPVAGLPRPLDDVLHHHPLLGFRRLPGAVVVQHLPQSPQPFGDEPALMIQLLLGDLSRHVEPDDPVLLHLDLLQVPLRPGDLLGQSAAVRLGVQGFDPSDDQARVLQHLLDLAPDQTLKPFRPDIGVLPAFDALVQHSVAVVAAVGRVQLVPVGLAVALDRLASIRPAAHEEPALGAPDQMLQEIEELGVAA